MDTNNTLKKGDTVVVLTGERAGKTYTVIEATKTQVRLGRNDQAWSEVGIFLVRNVRRV